MSTQPIRRSAIPIIVVLAVLTTLTPTRTLAVACDPGRVDDNIQRFIGSWISAGAGNSYDGIKGTIEQDRPYMESTPTQIYLAVYPAAGVQGWQRIGIRYNANNTQWFAEYVNKNGNVDISEVGALGAGNHHFETTTRLVAFPSPWIERLWKLDGVTVASYADFNGSDWWDGKRAFAFAGTLSLGSQIMGNAGVDPTDITSLNYRRNGGYHAWPNTAALVDQFGLDGGVSVAAGTTRIWDNDC